MTQSELAAYYRDVTIQATGGEGQSTVIEHFDGQRLRMRVLVEQHYQRPGGTVSGPALFALVDGAGWMMAVGQHGVGADAFTTDVTMHFLRPVPLGEVVVEASALKRGKRHVFEVEVQPGPDGPAIHATIAFSIRTAAR